MPIPRFDVAIVGGGLVGASLAIALDRIGRDVALVEAAPPGALPAVFDERNLSFAEATVHGLRALGVLQHLRAPSGAIRRIHVSRSGDFGRVLLEAKDHGREQFGQVVVARDFGEALEARLNQCTRVTRFRPMRFEGTHVEGDRDGDARVLTLRGADGAEQQIAARLLVGADGTRSGVRDALGIGADDHDFGQTLFVARVRTERAPDGTAYERFGPNGPTALLPRGDGFFGVVHGVPRDEAEAVAALDEAAWLARLQQAFGWRVGRFLASGARSAYPIVQVVARALVAERAAIVGNAAQTLHPIGAQGFNLGLRDALTLAELIEAADDPGASAVLEAHGQRRADDRAQTLQFSGGLAKLTANDDDGLRPWRSLGFGAVQHLPALRAQLVGGALGYRGDVPRLCRSGA
jgi:2-octaprenyl-6-methoxyphenol hydroxylase